jgi:hypothetical protein
MGLDDYVRIAGDRVYFTVGNQSFCIYRCGVEDHRSWFAEMLKKAVGNLIAMELKDRDEHIAVLEGVLKGSLERREHSDKKRVALHEIMREQNSIIEKLERDRYAMETDRDNWRAQANFNANRIEYLDSVRKKGGIEG